MIAIIPFCTNLPIVATKITKPATVVTLEPNTRIQLEQLTQADLSDLPAFCFQTALLPETCDIDGSAGTKGNYPQPGKVLQQNSFSKNELLPEPRMTFSLVTDPLTAELEKLSDKEFKKIVREKKNRPKEDATSKSAESGSGGIDLHIQELLDNISGLSNADMTEGTDGYLPEEMAKAIDLGVKKIVFIHGVGNGVLKNELRRELQRKYRKYSFQDASFQRIRIRWPPW